MRMNLPNQITVLRLFFTMAFVVLAAVPEDFDNSLLCWKIGYFISIIGGFTDFFDGYLARKYNLVTDFGKLMDPLTDKIFTVSAFIVLMHHGVVPFWIVIIILTREFGVTGLRSLAANQGVIMPASQSGKYKTVSQMLVLLFGGLFWVQYLPYEGNLLLIWKIVLYSLAAYTVYTGIEYFLKNKELYMNDL